MISKNVLKRRYRKKIQKIMDKYSISREEAIKFHEDNKKVNKIVNQ
jgi:hypothetical protein